MQYIYINSLEESSYEWYIEKLWNLDEEKPLTIIIDSAGWETYISDILINELQRFNYVIRCYTAMSNGLVLLDSLYHKAKSVHISMDGLYLAHLSVRSIYIWDNWKISRWEYEKYKYKVQKSLKPYEFKIMTEKEKKKYKKWEDIHFMPQRIFDYYSK